ncbi:MAG: polysaccharide biosynthesis tyrosine autokinase [Chitinophagaceae bacterium]|nr:MAG: polysaccharide biosynthesis tyrosine autokinase [Chitinophagaceae bacterium]
MASNFQATRSDQTGFNPKEFLFKYLRFLPLFILSLVLSLIIAFFYLRYTSPTFQSRGALVLTEDKSSGNSNDKFAQIFVDDRSKNIQNEIEYLKSKSLMTRVVDTLGLNVQYYAKGKIKQLNVYKNAPFRLQVLGLTDSARSFDLVVNFVNSGSFNLGLDKKKSYQLNQEFSTEDGRFRIVPIGMPSAGSQYSVRYAPVGRAVRSVLGGLTPMNKSGSSGIIILTMEADNASMAADVINELMNQYRLATVEDKNAKTQKTLDFLNGRLAIVNREVDSITRLVNEYQARHHIADAEAQTNNLITRSSATEDKIRDIRLQVGVLDAVAEYLRDRSKIYEKVPFSLDIQDASLQAQIQVFNTLQAERKKLISDDNVPPAHPMVKQVESQLEKNRIFIIESLNNVRRAYLANIGQLQQANASIAGEMSTLPAKQQGLAELKQALQTKADLFKFLNEKKEETAISLAATISNTRVLEQAEVSKAPVRPTSGKVRGIALLIGLMIPLLFVLVLEIMDDKITSRNDIERHTAATVLGEIGHAGAEDTLVVKPRSRSFIAEQVRIVRSNLQYVLTDIPPGKAPVLLITSSFSGEGKSFVSTNIGAVMALAGKRTVILEFDVRKPKILSGLGITKKPGLTNFMLGKSGIEELLVPVEGVENLFVLPCGPVPPNPAELLLDKKLDELFEYLTTHYDFLVMDTAPVGMVGDAMTLARFVDTTLYIVRQGVTHKKQLEMVNDFFLSGKLPKMNIILNDVKLRAGYGYYGYGRYGYGYGYGGSYGYGYGYGYGYYDDDVEGTSFIKRWFGWAMPAGSRKKKKTKKEKAG